MKHDKKREQPLEGELGRLRRRVAELERSDGDYKRMKEAYRAMAEQSLQGLVIIQDSRAVFANTAFAKISGYTLEELLSLSPVEVRALIHPEDQELVWGRFRDRLEGKHVPHRFEYRGIQKDGTMRWLEIMASRVKYRGKPAIQGAIIDITERKEAEEKLRNEKKHLESLIQYSALAIVTLDEGHAIVSCNRYFERLFLYKESEIIGKNLDEVVAGQEHLQDAVSYTKQILDGKAVHGSGARERKYGSPVEVEFFGVPVVIEGKVVGAYAIYRDISERKRAEEEKQNLVAQLVRAQKMEAIGTLAGGVAHDLNNILSGLVSYPELLLFDLPKDSPLRQPILTIQNSGQKATAIVQDLLTLARRGVPTTEVVNLNGIISKHLISPEFGKLKDFHPNVKLETDLETDLLPILGSPVHLSKTVMNLISNAAEAMPHGGKIYISTENRYIDHPMRGYDPVKEGDYATLIVSDTGVGIPEKDIEKIFEPFYTKKVMGRSGTGLGMAVVWGTVKDHKGYIDVKSTEGKGTTCTLYFPVTRKESAKDESRLSIEDYKGRGESILVVDDVKEQTEIAAQLLERLGYSVTSVSSGEEAVDYMKDNSADLLVLDMIMEPGIDGLETYKRILELRPGQKAIIVSGFSETERVREAQRLGAGAYIKKPYLLERIGLAVRDELER
ncbi:MAG: PAS domain S-box protein [Deltaproteobacteria bacterium]|nr:MAG: PAS domain S-box protein [Deltaproteobacteria bacterium]